MSEIRLNAYQIMWLFILFDLPTNTKKERKEAAQFRKALEKDGFTMFQFSVYIRHCPSKENMDVHINRVKYSMPPHGKVSIVSITDKQFGDMRNYYGRIEEKAKAIPLQLELF